MMPNPFDTIAALGVVPVIAIESVRDALPLADALLEGGLTVAEITFRTKAAAEVLSILAADRPDLILGAGTVLDVSTHHAPLDGRGRGRPAPRVDAHKI
jgi:2-dehydro-3-deoxyphosphogluconate aldolase/(4S)-4-hydroxy-2-oxoglutarate aldolase